MSGVPDDGYDYTYKNGKWYRESKYFDESVEISKEEVPLACRKQKKGKLKPGNGNKNVDDEDQPPKLPQKKPAKSSLPTAQRAAGSSSRYESPSRNQLGSHLQQSDYPSTSDAIHKPAPDTASTSENVKKRERPQSNVPQSPLAKRNLSTRPYHSSRSSKFAEKAISSTQLADLKRQLRISSSDEDNDMEGNDVTDKGSSAVEDKEYEPQEGFDYSFQLPTREEIPINAENRARLKNVKRRMTNRYKIFDKAISELGKIEVEFNKLDLVPKPENARIDAPLGSLDVGSVVRCPFPHFKITELAEFCHKRKLIPVNVTEFMLANPDRKPYFNAVRINRYTSLEDDECEYCKAHDEVAPRVARRDRNVAVLHVCPYLPCNCKKCCRVDLTCV